MYVRIDVYDDEDEKSTHNIGSLNLLDIAVYNAQQFCLLLSSSYMFP